MPIRRRDDGEIVEEPTEPVREKRSEGATEAPTHRQPARGPREDSLFEPRSGDTGGAARLEEPTVAMDAGKEETTRRGS